MNERIKVIEEMKKISDYEETHLHSKDIFDCDNPAEDVCKRLSEIGRKTVFLTQHGVAAMTWDFKNAAKKYGLKFVPGIETYFQHTAYKENGLMQKNGFEPEKHLILHAKNDEGWKAISMAISDGQRENGYCLMNDEILNKYFLGNNNVIATSACISGVIATVFRSNEFVEREIAKIRRAMEKGGISSNVSNLSLVEDKFNNLNQQLEERKSELERLKKLSKIKFSAREKILVSMDELMAEAERQRMENDKAEVEDAKAKIPVLTEEIKKLRTRISILKKELKQKTVDAEKSSVFNEKILELEKKKKTEEEMLEEARKEMEFFNNIFGQDNFFAEIQYHGMQEEKVVYNKIVNLARSMNIPLVAANDVHTVTNSNEELLKRMIMKSLRFEKWEPLQDADRELYIKTTPEMRAMFSHVFEDDVIEEAFDNTLYIAGICNVDFKITNHFPKVFKGKSEEYTNDVFMKELQDGISRLYPAGLPAEYQERLNREIEIIKKMGYVDYHLVVQDFNRYAAEYDSIPPEEIENAPIEKEALRAWKLERGFTTPVGIANGTGRGSAVGSLVCQLLGITHLDPIRFELLFERFLNPERVSLPDIDSDISNTIRPRTIEYVKQKYGEDCVVGIMTQNAQAPRGAIRAAARSYGFFLAYKNNDESYRGRFLSLADKIAKAIPSKPGLGFNTKLEKQDPNGAEITLYAVLIQKFADDKTANTIIKWAKVFENCCTAYGSHAAGVVITDGTPVKEIVPLRYNSKLGIYTTQCNMIEVEENGMLKFDFLGLKTLDIVTDCKWKLKERGINPEPYRIPLDNKETFEKVFAQAHTNSVFQFESKGMKKMLKRFEPSSFEDLIILVSMFRPGPMQYLDSVMDVKHGRKPVQYLTPELEPILGKTYGAIAYQEQVMQIFQKLAGYTLGGADMVRRYMSKKKMEKLELERHAFIEGDPDRGIRGCVANGINYDAASKLFDEMTNFAKYAFNKSHAAAYAYNSYVSGYLKELYPAEFLAGAMNWAEKTQAKDPLPELLIEAHEVGVKVLPPNVNYSKSKFTVHDGKILFGLASVKEVASAAKAIVENAPYTSFHDFIARSKADKTSVINLIKAGALDDFNVSRKAMLDSYDAFKTAYAKLAKKETYIQTVTEILPKLCLCGSDEELVEKQKELGLHVELKKLTTEDKLQKSLERAKEAVIELRTAFESLTITPVIETTEEKLADEKEVLGYYVSGSPLDNYGRPEELSATPISDMDANTTMIFGLITNVEIRQSKKTGNDMAFIVVQDQTGTATVNVFQKAYEQNKQFIKEGNVLLFSGKTDLDDFNSSDEDGEALDAEYKFTLQKCFEAKKKNGTYLVHSNAVSMQELENMKEDFGNTVYIYNVETKQTEKLGFTVSSKVNEICGVTKMS